MLCSVARTRLPFGLLTCVVFILVGVLAGCSEPSDSAQNDDRVEDSGTDSTIDAAEDTSTNDSGPDAECSPTSEAGRQTIDQQCTTCHSESLTGTDRQAAPEGLDLDTQSDHRSGPTASKSVRSTSGRCP